MNDVTRSEVHRITDLILTVGASSRRGPMNVFQAKSRKTYSKLADEPSGPLVVKHGVDNMQRNYALVEFANRSFHAGEYAPLILWCREHFEVFEVAGSIMFVFQNENDVLAFKMRWAGLTSKDIACSIA
ncbi:MAG: hypothetical protein EOO77_20095 [Oxalobacteraceae bacterium]|nr:MAG: hypothetical protein EOO77_20095 [Oxalobacteraceae bacterium]